MEATYKLTVTELEFELDYESDQMFMNEELMDQFLTEHPDSEMQGARGELVTNKNTTITYTLVVQYQ